MGSSENEGIHEGANYTGEARTVRRHERSLASAAQPSVLLFASTQADAGQGVPASQGKAEVDCGLAISEATNKLVVSDPASEQLTCLMRSEPQPRATRSQGSAINVGRFYYC
jgi:hypothetical protein